MEVGTAGTHSTCIQGKERSHHVCALLNIFTRNDGDSCCNLESISFVCFTTFGESFIKALSVETVFFRREEQWKPSIANLCRERNVLRTLCSKKDWNVGAERMNGALERFAKTSAAFVWHVVMGAVVIHWLFTTNNFADDFYVFTCARKRTWIGLAVPTFGNLWSRRTESKNESTATEVVHSHRCHCSCCRCAGTHLHDGSA